MNEERGTAGFAVLDNKGRLTLPRVVRSALAVESGSTVAYIVAGNTLLVVPQDAHLAGLMERASSAVASAGLTAEDYLDALPAIREDLLLEHYDTRMLSLLRDEHARVRQGTTSSADEGDPPVVKAE